MKINRFNESFITDSAIEYNHISLDNGNLSMITKFDIKALHDKGLRIYTISKEFELVEQTRADHIRKMRYGNNLHKHFQTLLVITEEYSEVIKKYLVTFKELEKQKEEETKLRFKTIIGLSQRDVNIKK